MAFRICMLKERKGRDVITKCERSKGVTTDQVTVWHTDVTCPDCLALMRGKT